MIENEDEQKEQDDDEKLRTQTKTIFDIWHNLLGQGESLLQMTSIQKIVN